VAFGLTEPDHGSDATWMGTTAFNSGVHTADADLVITRTSGSAGDASSPTRPKRSTRTTARMT
jgi:acyl-CoA dehydrogenase